MLFEHYLVYGNGSDKNEAPRSPAGRDLRFATTSLRGIKAELRRSHSSVEMI
jgi:hypothetical protein